MMNDMMRVTRDLGMGLVCLMAGIEQCHLSK